MKKIIVVALVFAMATGAAFARGQSDSPASVDQFPSRPVVGTVAWPAGTAADMVFRALAEVFPKYANNQPFVIDNKPDAAGGVAGVVDFMRNASPDGYSVLQWMIAHVIKSHWDDVPFAGNSFEPVCQVVSSYNYVSVAADSRWRTLQDLVNEARANPNQISMGNAGQGGGNHMAAVMLEHAAGVQFRHTPFQGGNLSITGLMTGDCQASMNIAPEGITNAQAGQIRILATLSPNRFADFPNVPTAREAGVNTVFEQWRGVVVPRGTPPAIVQRLQDIFKQCVEDPVYIERMKSMNATAVYTDIRTFNQHIESENKRIEDVIRSAKIGNRYK